MVLPNKNNYDQVASEIEHLLLQELDFRREREFYEFYYEALQGMPMFHVPKIYPQGCTTDVLTTEWMEGEGIDKWLARTSGKEEFDEQRNKIGQAVAEILFLEIFTLKHIQTDPNPGNFLVQPDGRLGLLDFGATQKLSTEVMEDYRLLTHGIIYEKPGEVSRASTRLNLIKRDDSEHIWDSYTRIMRIVGEPFRSETYNWKNCGLAKRVREEGMRFGMITKLRPPPAEIVFLHRRILGTQLLLENIGCQFAARGVVQKFINPQL